MKTPETPTPNSQELSSLLSNGQLVHITNLHTEGMVQDDSVQRRFFDRLQNGYGIIPVIGIALGADGKPDESIEGYAGIYTSPDDYQKLAPPN